MIRRRQVRRTQSSIDASAGAAPWKRGKTEGSPVNHSPVTPATQQTTNASTAPYGNHDRVTEVVRHSVPDRWWRFPSRGLKPRIYPNGDNMAFILTHASTVIPPDAITQTLHRHRICTGPFTCSGVFVAERRQRVHVRSIAHFDNRLDSAQAATPAEPLTVYFEGPPGGMMERSRSAW